MLIMTKKSDDLWRKLNNVMWLKMGRKDLSDQYTANIHSSLDRYHIFRREHYWNIQEHSNIKETYENK